MHWIPAPCILPTRVATFGPLSREVGPRAHPNCQAFNSAFSLPACFHLQVNVIHTANPVDHASHIAAQPQFVQPVHHSFVDLSGHNLANPHPGFSGKGFCPSSLMCIGLCPMTTTRGSVLQRSGVSLAPFPEADDALN